MEGSAKRRLSASRKKNKVRCIPSVKKPVPKSPQTNASTHHVNQTKNTNTGNISPHLLLRGQTKDTGCKQKKKVPLTVGSTCF